jgi:hypothetical protein
MAVIGRVQVELEDIGLAVGAIDLDGEQNGVELALRSCVVSLQIDLLGELLRNRAAALAQAALHDVVEDCAERAAGIDPCVARKARVFDHDR